MMSPGRFRLFAPCLISFLLLPGAVHGQVIGGPLQADTTLEGGPWLVDRMLVVGPDVTLEITAGTEVRFESDAGIRVENGGELRVTGRADARVTLTRIPETSDRWQGIVLEQTDADNVLHHVDMIGADGGDEAIHVDHARLTIDDVLWTDTDQHVLYLDHPKVLVRNSTFPAADGIEPVNGQSLESGEYFVLRNNTFHAATGYNDIIDFSDCDQPGPVLEVYDNLFLGGSDDGLDLDGCDAHIEGNTFIGFHKGHDGSSTSNAIATGFRYDRTANVTVVRNVFVDNDHAILLKEDAFLWAEHNVFYGATEAAINFSEWPDRDVEPARGAYLAGNIFADNAAIFDNLVSQPGYADPVVEVHRSILPEMHHDLGTGNLDVDPAFVDPPADFHLAAGSPALGAGPLGLDLGAFVASGVHVVGPATTGIEGDQLRIDVGGPGVTACRYALDDTTGSAWSETLEIDEQPALVLENLTPGSHTVYVRGRSFTGVWYDETAVLGPYEVTGTNTSNEAPSTLTLEVSVAPNPFMDVLTLRLEGDPIGGVVEIYDVLGRQVAELPLARAGSQQIDWDSHGLAAGVYVLRINTPHGRVTRNVVKAR